MAVDQLRAYCLAAPGQLRQVVLLETPLLADRQWRGHGAIGSHDVYAVDVMGWDRGRRRRLGGCGGGLGEAGRGRKDDEQRTGEGREKGEVGRVKGEKRRGANPLTLHSSSFTLQPARGGREVPGRTPTGL